MVNLAVGGKRLDLRDLRGDFQSRRLYDSIQKPKGLKHLGNLPKQPSGKSTFTWRWGAEDKQYDFL